MTEPRRRAPRGQGAALRGEVLQAAMDLLRETGDEASVSLRLVAQRVGVSVPAIYLHFEDKAALLDAVCEEVFGALHVAMKEASEGAPDAFQALRRQGIAYVRFALANPEHYRIVMMRSSADHDVSDEIAGGAFSHLLDSVVACEELGVLEGDPVELGLRLWAGAHGIAALLIAKPSFPWPPVEDLVERAVHAVGLGLAAASRMPDVIGAEEVVTRLNRLRAESSPLGSET
ncbi:MAG TPA: TetR/AcrR family transcriptional regulator [Mycobacteriales bacterium]|nr:TetR/AcrR family transcriptional regulator [Mycobacteriales bacterium]